LNQASAQVLVYTDGTVLLSHSAVEMGQGVNIKMIQVAAQAFGIAPHAVRIAECSSDRCINTSPTAASMGADLNGMATLHGCEQIRARLAPLIAEFPDDTFAQLCKKAYKRQISLSAVGFYASPYGGAYVWVCVLCAMCFDLTLTESRLSPPPRL
jgi:xanthine dehydrogenase/oxidase|tara:strand:+ start:117 stop:581 length:465 start_codon:yes stop_codon:yes gene_type:complete